MEFFVPNAPEDEVEERYAVLAEFAGVAVPPLSERLYSIQWVSNEEVWEATIGEPIVRVDPRPKEWGNADVLAIFPGTPYMIVTSAQPFGPEPISRWHNPIMAGVPPYVRNTVRFDDA